MGSFSVLAEFTDQKLYSKKSGSSGNLLMTNYSYHIETSFDWFPYDKNIAH